MLTVGYLSLISFYLDLVYIAFVLEYSFPVSTKILRIWSCVTFCRYWLYLYTWLFYSNLENHPNFIKFNYKGTVSTAASRVYQAGLRILLYRFWASLRTELRINCRSSKRCSSVQCDCCGLHGEDNKCIKKFRCCVSEVLCYKYTDCVIYWETFCLTWFKMIVRYSSKVHQYNLFSVYNDWIQ